MVSGEKGFALYDKDFDCLCVIPLDYKIKLQILFAHKHEENVTLVYDAENNKKIVTLKHVKPRMYVDT